MKQTGLPATEYNCQNGKLIQYRSWKCGKKHGVWMFADKIIIHEIWKDGKEDGEWTYYFENKSLRFTH